MGSQQPTETPANRSSTSEFSASRVEWARVRLRLELKMSKTAAAAIEQLLQLTSRPSSSLGERPLG